MGLYHLLEMSGGNIARSLRGLVRPVWATPVNNQKQLDQTYNPMKKLTIVLSVLAASATLAFAEDGAKKDGAKKEGAPGGPGGRRGGGNPEEFFKKLDSNGDGGISLDEFKAGPRAQKDPSKAEERFKQLDTNGDGKLSLEELKAGHHAPGGPGGPGGRGPKPQDGGAKPQDGAAPKQ